MATTECAHFVLLSYKNYSGKLCAHFIFPYIDITQMYYITFCEVLFIFCTKVLFICYIHLNSVFINWYKQLGHYFATVVGNADRKCIKSSILSKVTDFFMSILKIRAYGFDYTWLLLVKDCLLLLLLLFLYTLYMDSAKVTITYTNNLVILLNSFLICCVQHSGTLVIFIYIHGNTCSSSLFIWTGKSSYENQTTCIW